MPKSSEFPSEDGETKKTKKLPLNNFSRCKEPWCADKIWVNDNMDIDLEIAKHKFYKHGIPFPDWAQGVDNRKSKYIKHEKKPYVKD